MNWWMWEIGTDIALIAAGFLLLFAVCYGLVKLYCLCQGHAEGDE